MFLRSLGFRTDLRLLEMTGSQIEDRGTHLVIRTPSNPTYFWGNFLVLEQLPVPGGEREVIGAFHTEFPEAEHVSIGIDGVDDLTEQLQPFVDADMEADVGTVLTAGALTEPRPVAEGVVIRPLESDDDWEQRARLAHHLWAKTEEATFMTYARGKNEQERALVAKGVGQRFGAFVDDAMVSTAAVFVTHAGVARYQTVETHPDHRRQGLAAAVVHAAGEHALAAYKLEKLVIAADTDGDAIRLYRGLGFSDVERHNTLERRPQEWN
ncbi:MAG: GNAT family N-acetyltransferase [Nocardioides sp.]|uniref:GNAT family N-acetyltransferase n=1 Tax=Nocardioides sp. TaxID=35761 RepID=UPI003267B0BA